MRMVADGINLRRAERLLQVHHTTILRWKRATAAHLAETPPQPQMTDELELDELYTFVTQKKQILPRNGGGSDDPYDYGMRSDHGADGRTDSSPG